jgi:hypothetical protein
MAEKHAPGTGTWDVPLPPDRAFVVQLRRPTGPDGELFVGRVEHTASGDVGRFTSGAELLAFIAGIGSRTRPENSGDR